MYSQNKEEEVILNYFQKGNPRHTNLYGVPVGTFIDIGANDGVTFSNTRRLTEMGWSGVFVEPSPKAFAKLKENYRDIKGKFYFYNYALVGKLWLKENGLKNGDTWPHFKDSGTHLNNNDVGLLSTLSNKDYDKWKGSTIFTEVPVKVFLWKTFLNRLSIRSFDVISLDAEGADLDILKQIDLRETSLVCVEWNSKPEMKAQFDALCIGFRLIYENGENLIYAR